MLFIKELNPQLSTQKDSIRARLMPLSERRRIFKLLTKMVLNFSILSQFFIVKKLSYKKNLMAW